jgi:hypothetical protein
MTILETISALDLQRIDSDPQKHMCVLSEIADCMHAPRAGWPRPGSSAAH